MDFDHSFEDAVSTAPVSSPPPADSASDHPLHKSAPRADGRSLRRLAKRRGWKLPITDGPFAESKEL